MRPSQWYETPDLVGEHVLLTQLRVRHAPGVLAAADHPDLFAWMSFERPDDLDEARAMIDNQLAGRQFITWAQVAVGSGEVAGTTSYYDIDPEQRTLAIGATWLGRRFQRTAINTEAKLLLLTRAFDDLRAVRVVWHTDIRNEQSQTAISALGATREGVLRKHRRRNDGTWRDTVQYAMTDDDWPEVKTRLTSRAAGRSTSGARS